MNETVMLSGLARQLVDAQLLAEAAAQQAVVKAKQAKVPLVTYLVQQRLVQSRPLAELAAQEFGVPFLDLSAIDKEQLPKDIVNEKLMQQHHFLPLNKRGNKLFIALSDPTNQQAINDVSFGSKLAVEVVLVEDDKLDRKSVV